MQDSILNSYQGPAGAKMPQSQPSIPSVPAPRLRWNWAVSLALVLLVLVAYWGVWNYDFTYFDDPGYVSENLNVTRGLPLKDPRTLRASVYWAFTAFEQSNWHPLSWLSHMLDVQIYGIKGTEELKPGDGLGAGGHHLTNIILHELNVLLVFWLLLRLTGRTWPSAVVAALFAVHPMHVESVAWVAERKDMLSTCLGLLTLIIYVSYVRRAKPRNDMMVLIGVLGSLTCLGALICFNAFHFHVDQITRDVDAKYLLLPGLWLYPLIFLGAALWSLATQRWCILLYCAVFALFAVGLLAKPMLVTLPFVCLLLDYWPLNRLRLERNDAPLQALVERPAGPRRRARRNQRLPAARRVAPMEPRAIVAGNQSLLLLAIIEKVPLLALSAISAIITPYAQGHGGSMASSQDLSFFFRMENAMQSYLTYISRMFWPGRMSVLYLLDTDHVNHLYTAAAVVTLLLITGLVIWGTLLGRRYLAFGWFWFLGTLVPVIGLVQVGEQTHADRYTYIPYIGLFIMLAWGVADLIGRLPRAREAIQFAASLVMIVVLSVCVGWSKYQLQFWTGVEIHLRHALTITPDNWNMLNNLGVYLWKQAQKRDKAAVDAEATGDAAAAADYRAKSKLLKKDAMSQWIHGITARSTATDIDSNLGYAYSEAANQAATPEERRKNLDLAEYYLTQAVVLKEISPRPHNNLGRVLLSRSEYCEQDARDAEAKGNAEAAKQLRTQALSFRNRAIEQFEKSVSLDPTLLEARLNLGQVYIALNNLDKASEHYHKIIELQAESVIDKDALNNFSQAHLFLGRIALNQRRPEEAIEQFKQAVITNPDNLGAIEALATESFASGRYREADQAVWMWLARLPLNVRQQLALQLGNKFEHDGKNEAAFRAWGIMAWIFATGPDQLRDPQFAAKMAEELVRKTQGKDPLVVDVFAASQAANGQFPAAIQNAQVAIALANSQGNKALAELIARRLESYQKSTPYTSDPRGSDRPQ